MKRTTITLPDELARLVDNEAKRRKTSFSEVVRLSIIQGLSGSKETPREVPFAGLFNEPEMIPAERMDEALAEGWAGDTDRDRR